MGVITVFRFDRRVDVNPLRCSGPSSIPRMTVSSVAGEAGLTRYSAPKRRASASITGSAMLVSTIAGYRRRAMAIRSGRCRCRANISDQQSGELAA
jgi:hypothetical protein